MLFLASVIFFTIGYSCCHFTRQDTDISNKYIYIGNCIDSLISENYRSNFNRIEYEDGVDPYGVYNKKMELLKMQIWHIRLQIRYYQTYMVVIK